MGELEKAGGDEEKDNMRFGNDDDDDVVVVGCDLLSLVLSLLYVVPVCFCTDAAAVDAVEGLGNESEVDMIVRDWPI